MDARKAIAIITIATIATGVGSVVWAAPGGGQIAVSAHANAHASSSLPGWVQSRIEAVFGGSAHGSEQGEAQAVRHASERGGSEAAHSSPNRPLTQAQVSSQVDAALALSDQAEDAGGTTLATRAWTSGYLVAALNASGHGTASESSPSEATVVGSVYGNIVAITDLSAVPTNLVTAVKQSLTLGLLQETKGGAFQPNKPITQAQLDDALQVMAQITGGSEVAPASETASATTHVHGSAHANSSSGHGLTGWAQHLFDFFIEMAAKLGLSS